ncbi:MAG: hypothetical protein CMH23_02535 [Methylophaga sp.]|uniref:hypothetical protein n=1 Tax=Methylophaga sp. TaxID=2024840 RepID=UPI000C8F23C0|nr:hypothetical protein [Methylophaga sp.]MBN45330.1 hypothetical protein [Methylophaga sp.]
MKQKVIGNCMLCKEKKELQLSHAIPDAVFRRLLAQDSGKAIQFGSYIDKVGYSSDSWATHQLCSSCETLINTRYEHYFLKVLRGEGCSLTIKSWGLVFTDLEQDRLIMYFLSLYWRAANSYAEQYSNVTIESHPNETLRKAILDNEKSVTELFSVKLSRLNAPDDGPAFTPNAVKSYIQSPFSRTDRLNKISYCFVFEGFLFEIFIKRLNFKRRVEPGVLSSIKSRLIIPFLSMYDVEEIKLACIDGQIKQLEGKTTIKSRFTKVSPSKS